MEPGRGADSGLPDTFVLAFGRFIPIELKRGRSVVKELRPSQRMWHKSSILLRAATFGATIHDGVVDVFQLILLEHSLAGKLDELLLATIRADSFSYSYLVDALKASSDL